MSDALYELLKYGRTLKLDGHDGGTVEIRYDDETGGFEAETRGSWDGHGDGTRSYTKDSIDWVLKLNSLPRN